jgi:hypothetical protein
VVVWGFGWSGGKVLVQQSYEDAKARAAEQKAERAAGRRRENPAGQAGGSAS